MTLAREQAIQAMRSFDLDISVPGLSMADAIQAITIARRLESKQRKLVFTELATRAWLVSRPLGGPIYPEFENMLWEYLLRHENVEEKVLASLSDNRANKDVDALYSNYLKGMFAASGKKRLEFYNEMLTEAGISVDLEDVEFGDEAVNFFLRVANSMHREHLLVYYSAGLVSRLSAPSDPTMNEAMGEEKLDAICRYFENGMPLEDHFLEYSKDDIFLRCSLLEGHLSKIK